MFSGMFAGGLTGALTGITGVIWDKDFKDIIVGAAEGGALSGIGGGLAATFGMKGALLGGALQGAANAYLNRAKTWQTYAASTIMGALFSGAAAYVTGAAGEDLFNQWVFDTSLSLAGTAGSDLALAVALAAE